MDTIFYSTDAGKVLKVSAKAGKGREVIVFGEGLRARPDGQTGVLASVAASVLVSDEQQLQIEKAYVDTIARLSHSQPVQWWANDVSEKNEHLPDLYLRLHAYYVLIKTLEAHRCWDKDVYVFLPFGMAPQFKDFCQKKGIRSQPLDNPAAEGFVRIFENLRELLKIFFFFLRISFRKIIILLFLNQKIKKDIQTVDAPYCIRSWLDGRFINQSGPYDDSYFGQLPEYLLTQGRPVVLVAGIIRDFWKIVGKLRNFQGFLVVPEEYFLSLGDCLRLGVESFLKPRHHASAGDLLGVDVSLFLKDEAFNAYRRVSFLRNRMRYFVGRRLAAALKFENYIQTFENYAWEKMMILGMRAVRPDAPILGWQHAFISRNSFKYFIGAPERQRVPLPDRIITLGDRTKQIMLEFGAYDQDRLRVGCALRQAHLTSDEIFPRRNFRKCLVPLTMVEAETLRILHFLFQSNLGSISSLGNSWEVIIRPHPATDFDGLVRKNKIVFPENIKMSRKRNVREDLNEVDIILYTWSTVAIEALKLGLPAVYMDILKPMHVDPLFECGFLKRSIDNPDDLLPVINGFWAMDDVSFLAEQKLAQDYLRSYFNAVNDKSLSVYLSHN